MLNAFSLAASIAVLLSAPLAAAERWAPWVEPDFPFFSSSLDLRQADPQSRPYNITPRGIILNLGNDCWACFDTDLLRLSAIWAGKGVNGVSLAPLSYHKGIKTIGGQSKLPTPEGKLWMMNGVYPGWQVGDSISLTDPRKPQPTPEEPGRGPLPAKVAHFRSIHMEANGVILEYTIGGTAVREVISSVADGKGVQRSFSLSTSAQPLSLIIGRKNPSMDGTVVVQGSASLGDHPEVWSVEIAASGQPIKFDVIVAPDRNLAEAPQSRKMTRPGPRWSQELTTRPVLSEEKAAYVLDDIPLPLDNPWRRNVRFADVSFFKNGAAVACTFDGDVWVIRSLGDRTSDVRWKRFTSGLHEPMGIAVRDERIFVFDRNGIWKLIDTDADGEADVHELFCNVFPQSAETREFPNSMKLGPNGTFIIAKGGQQASTISELNGSVLQIAADGKSYEVLGYGFRQPFAGVHPGTGMVTASDQEGHYVPTTPLYILKKPEYHGYLSEILPKEKYPEPIADPLTWIPHSVNPSAASQTWLVNAKMGPLNDALIHVGFNRPELFRVLLNDRSPKPQAALVSVVRNFDLPVLNAAVNPADGMIYMTGFQVMGWGTTAKRESGLMRVRYTGAPVTIPRQVVPTEQGMLLRFEVALDRKVATNPENYSIESWHYKRTHQYGSPHLTADGPPGQDWLTPSSAYLSEDGKGVFIGIPKMKPVQQLRIGWSLATAEGEKMDENTYLTPYDLAKFDPQKEGFGAITVDLTPRATVPKVKAPATAEEGERIYKMMGCMACHTTDDIAQQGIGPAWKGLFGSKRDIAKGPPMIADEAYLRESILTPAAKIVKGYEKVEAGMPVYAGVLTDSQVESIILFIKTLK